MVWYIRNALRVVGYFTYKHTELHMQCLTTSSHTMHRHERVVCVATLAFAPNNHVTR